MFNAAIQKLDIENGALYIVNFKRPEGGPTTLFIKSLPYSV